MDPEPTKKSEADQAVTDTAKDPKKAAGSLNPKEKAPFYEAVAKKGRLKRNWGTGPSSGKRS